MARRNRILQTDEPAAGNLIEQIRTLSHALNGPADLDPLIEHIGDAQVVLLGEASHGTADYYAWRAEISKRLIAEKGFSFLAVEGDWPDCYRVNRYVKHYADAGDTARQVLHDYERWPTWMWANDEVADLAEWLRRHNDGQAPEKKVGFYGLDVYSLWDSLYAVMGYLRKNRPEALPAARRALQCFEPYGEDVQEYARATVLVPTSCEREVVALLQELRRQPPRANREDGEAQFVAEQNALVVKNAEAYYRAMVRGGSESWNVRDRHMTLTLGRLLRHHGDDAKAIVWEHNTHVGDARFTDMADEGMVNVGQLARERFEDRGVVIVGFGSHRGTVIAGKEWEAPMEIMPVPPGRGGSWEDVLHQAGGEDRLLLFGEQSNTPELRAVRGHRAIGVVYRPQYEQFGNYVPTVLPRRYDAFLFIDETKALHPLHVTFHEEHEVPETYPSGV